MQCSKFMFIKKIKQKHVSEKFNFEIQKVDNADFILIS